MHNEQRKHPRISVKELKAHVSIDRIRQAPIEIDGDVIDISYTGIKIRLNSPLPEKSEGIVKIVIVLPESKIPITIHGEIKHYCPHFEYGLHHGNYSTEEALDELMFECVKQTQTNIAMPTI
ncbi:PilZ domain-containing protein [Methylotuvimicrobium alcaliphilum]|uniref:PilZ domain-containing protein n=1 Tax=Methylotuvimicrobium alcaliphilum (strain DSM 19304 / NCIMB 14124 / VKM B-2133 / 20Z) TaxID=1091494 RepID=G4T2L4_META2|nr:PilZ domain-containing protein [Methylotuvimicrobium alcaliphilum]CCE24743.1 protein of unknown function [Methylotuvimicrobium alcaliphilum 20Z]